MSGNVDRWIMYRAVLYNFWYYPNQELIFKDGCAVLRGHNGSGKSVTTQSLITVLLDGDTRPHKLDPFGGKERKITDTVLGEEQLLKQNHRIGYLALEFKKRSGITKTIGMGIEADREKKKSTSWYFVVDGKRIGEEEHNLRLYSKEWSEGEKRDIPFTVKDLRNEIETRLRCGKVYDHREEYAKAVNKHLFGFEEDGYKGLINLLMQARSPRLSDQNKPEGAAEVLNDSLPQLSDEELRPLMSSIESIDRVEKDLVAYKKDLRRIQSLNEVYQSYNEIVFAEKADAYLNAVNKYELTKKEISDLEKQLEKNKVEFDNTEIEIRKTKDEIDVRKEEKANLGVDEIETLRNRREDLIKTLTTLENRLKAASNKKDDAIRLINQYKSSKGQQEVSLYKTNEKHDDTLEEIASISELMEYENHLPFFEHYSSNTDISDYSFISWRNALDEYKKRIEDTKVLIEDYEKILGEKSLLEEAMGNIRMQIDKCQSDIDDTQEKYETALTQLRENISAWKIASFNLDISIDLEDSLLMNLEDVYEEISKEEYMKPLSEHFAKISDDIKGKLLQIDFDIKNETVKLNNLNDELKSWQELSEVEPEFAFNKRNDWDLLREKGIEFTPFYEAYEFKEEVGLEQRIVIQNALYESGILSSVVVPVEKVDMASKITTVMTYRAEKKNNISQVLKGVGSSYFDQLLHGISFEYHEKGFILNDGCFENGFVKGISALYNENVFIGKLAREEYRQKKINEIQLMINDKKESLVSLGADRESQRKLHEEITEEFESFPAIDSLKTYLNTICHLQSNINNVLEPQKENLTLNIGEKEDKAKQLKTAIMSAVNYSNLKLDSGVYNNELKNIYEYSSLLIELEYRYKDIQNIKEKITSLEEQISLQEGYRDVSHDEWVDADLEIKKIKNRIKTVTDQLENLGDKEILNRVEELSILINKTLPETIESLTEKKTGLGKDIEEVIKKMENKRTIQLPFDKMLNDSWERVFKEQLLLNILVFEEELKSNIEKAQYVLEKFGKSLDKGRVNIGEAKRKLSKKFQDEHTELPTYELELDHKISEYAPVWDSYDSSVVERINYIKDQMSREVITLEVDEVRVSPAVAVERLIKRIKDLEEDAQEKDRQLYQDILINSLGAEIRKKIQYVERWEKEMNNYMEHENIIKFRIKWVPKKADPTKEDEMGTKELVDALKKDSRWVDIDKIAKHFRGKIAYAKERFEKENEEKSLQQIMRGVLDYRSWFEFQIYFTKKGDKEKQLTRNTYGELSGGQRVLAMVTPVLAALYAKYSEGREDAPRIFTLDEAFARVDDENIKIMFDYIYKLGFNYILNSQSLWGTFDTVPSLNIYELSRPDNRPFVAIQSYYWNGHKRERIGDEWFAQEREPAVALATND